MNSEALQKAIDSLEIVDVYMDGMNCTTQKDYSPKYDPNINDYEVQFKHFVREWSVVELEEGEKLLRVRIELGVRWVPENLEDNGEQIEQAKIEASFVAEYKFKNDLQNDSLEEFSLKNASYHVWPYWRELVASHSERMRLPRVMMPTVQFAANHLSNDEVTE